VTAVHRIGSWRIEVTVRPGVPRPVPGTQLARLAATALAAAGAPAPASLAIILADDAELAELNVTHMGHAGPTDVLSFPLLAPAQFPAHPKGDWAAATPGPATAGAAAAPGQAATSGPEAAVPAFALPPGALAHLGDIVISVERAIEQAATGQGGQTGDRRWTAAQELRLLVVHGVLHVCGWDHADPVEAAAMRALEQQLLA
jgi:probable rRNA maturation factor